MTDSDKSVTPKKNPHKVLRKKIIKVSVSEEEYQRLKFIAGKKPVAKFMRETSLINSPMTSENRAQKQKASHGYDENVYYEFVRQGINLNLLVRELLTQVKRGTITREDFYQLNKTLNDIRSGNYSLLQAHQINFIDLTEG